MSDAPLHAPGQGVPRGQTGKPKSGRDWLIVFHLLFQGVDADDDQSANRAPALLRGRDAVPPETASS